MAPTVLFFIFFIFAEVVFGGGDAGSFSYLRNRLGVEWLWGVHVGDHQMHSSNPYEGKDRQEPVITNRM